MKIELKIEEINMLLTLLSEKPLKEVIDIFLKIKQQAVSQMEGNEHD